MLPEEEPHSCAREAPRGVIAVSTRCLLMVPLGLDRSLWFCIDSWGFVRLTADYTPGCHSTPRWGDLPSELGISLQPLSRHSPFLPRRTGRRHLKRLTISFL
jgi:hypothetical protein